MDPCYTPPATTPAGLTVYPQPLRFSVGADLMCCTLLGTVAESQGTRQFPVSTASPPSPAAPSAGGNRLLLFELALGRGKNKSSPIPHPSLRMNLLEWICNSFWKHITARLKYLCVLPTEGTDEPHNPLTKQKQERKLRAVSAGKSSSHLGLSKSSRPIKTPFFFFFTEDF